MTQDISTKRLVAYYRELGIFTSQHPDLDAEPTIFTEGWQAAERFWRDYTLITAEKRAELAEHIAMTVGTRSGEVSAADVLVAINEWLGTQS
jgi:hypothetical protein